MTITIPFLILAALGVVIAALIIAVLWLLVWMVRHLTSFSKALSAHGEINAAQANELLANVNARRADRESYDTTLLAQRAAAEAERQQFRAEISQFRLEVEQASHLLSTELIKVKGKLSLTEAKVDTLQLENERLQARVETLEAEAKEKDGKISALTVALGKSEKNNLALVNEIGILRKALDGKADKPAPEPGEGVTPLPERTSEETETE
jgi:chromosome segregation ATPase